MMEQPLRGWKDIGAFLGTSSRTAQRWERELALPVHRLRTSTGSVVSAYPSELHAWRTRVDPEGGLGQGTKASDQYQEPEAEGPSEGLAIIARPAPSPSHPPRLAARWLPAAAAATVLTAAAIWMWPNPQAPRVPPSISAFQAGTGKRPATGPAPTPAPAGVVREAALLRFTSGTSTVSLRVRRDETATLAIPGVPELGVRAVPSGSELTVELYRNSGRRGTPNGLVRVASLRLVRREPALFEVAGAARIDIAWENGQAKPN